MSIERSIKDIINGTDAIMENANMDKRLDMLVRQGLMPASKLPILKRGLAKLNGGKALAPQERDSVNSLMNSFMFIVLGDDTVFNRAKTQMNKNKGMHEEVGEDEEDDFLTDEEVENLFGEDDFVYDEDLAEDTNCECENCECDPCECSKESVQEAYKLYHKSYTDAINTAHAHHAKSGLKVSDDDRMSHIGIGSKKPGSGKTTSVNVPASHHKTGDSHTIHTQVYNKGGTHPYELNTYSSKTPKKSGPKSKNEEVEHIAEYNKPVSQMTPSEKSANNSRRKEYNDYQAKSRSVKTAIKWRVKPPAGTKNAHPDGMQPDKVKPMKKESVDDMANNSAPSKEKQSYKDKFDAMLKATGKTLADMSDEEKKAFFAKVDAGHDAKNEETSRGISFVDHALEEKFDAKHVGHNVARSLTKNHSGVRPKYHADGSASIAHRGFSGVSSTTQADNTLKKLSGHGIEHNHSEKDLISNKQSGNHKQHGKFSIHTSSADGGNSHTTTIKEDANHDAKNESTHPQLEGFLENEARRKAAKEKGMAPKRKVPGKTTMTADPKTGKVTRSSIGDAKKAVAGGHVYAEEKMDGVADGALEGDKHQCATKIFKEGLGEGTPLLGEHSIPDADGNIAWYKTMFESGIQVVNTADSDVEILMSEGHMNHKKKSMKEGAAEDARRDVARDSKGLAPTKQDKPDVKHDGKKDKGVEHIVPQLRKAISIGKHVTFQNGKSHEIPKGHAAKFLNKYLNGKPHEKQTMQDHAHQSHDHFKKHI